MNTIATASAGQSLAATSLANLPFGSQLGLAIEIMGATSRGEMEDGYARAREFANHYSFRLPDAALPLAAEDYRSSVAIPFADEMRPTVDGELIHISKETSPSEVFAEAGITPRAILDSAILGLATFHAANKSIFSMMRDLGRRIELTPNGSDAQCRNGAFPVFATASCASLATFLMSNQNALQYIAVGATLLLAVMTIVRGMKIDAHDLHVKSEGRTLKACLQRDMIVAATSHMGLLGNRDRIPHLGEPCPRPSLIPRTVAISHRDPKGDLTRVLRKPEDFDGLEDTLLKYLVVRVAENGETEVRITPAASCHSDILLLGERIVGAGHMVMIRMEHGRRVIMFDGRSEVFATRDHSVWAPSHHIMAKEAGLIEVFKALKSVAGENIEILEALDDIDEFAPKKS